jgi:hypothetical protein
MIGESAAIELVNETSPEIVGVDEKAILVGRTAMPEDAKQTYAHLAKGSDQLVIERLAYDFETTLIPID